MELQWQSLLVAPIVFRYVHPTTTVKYLSNNESLQLEQQQDKTITVYEADTIMSIHMNSTKKAVHVLIHMHAMGGQDPLICANPYVHVSCNQKSASGWVFHRFNSLAL